MLLDSLVTVVIVATYIIQTKLLNHVKSVVPAWYGILIFYDAKFIRKV